MLTLLFCTVEKCCQLSELGQAGAIQSSFQTYLKSFWKDCPTIEQWSIQIYVPADWLTNSKQHRQAALGSAPSPSILAGGKGEHHMFLHNDQGIQQVLTQTSACKSSITWLPARHREVLWSNWSPVAFSHAGSEGCAPGWSCDGLSVLCGGKPGHCWMHTIWGFHVSEQLCTSLRTRSPHSHCVDAVIYKVWMREWVLLNSLSSSVGRPWSKNTVVCLTLSLSSSLSCLPLHSLSLAGNNCLSSTQYFK